MHGVPGSVVPGRGGPDGLPGRRRLPARGDGDAGSGANAQPRLRWLSCRILPARCRCRVPGVRPRHLPAGQRASQSALQPQEQLHCSPVPAAVREHVDRPNLHRHHHLQLLAVRAAAALHHLQPRVPPGQRASARHLLLCPRLCPDVANVGRPRRTQAGDPHDAARLPVLHRRLHQHHPAARVHPGRCHHQQSGQCHTPVVHAHQAREKKGRKKTAGRGR